jgi:broad specificity phosphatase PhoE
MLPTERTTRLLLVRHGESVANVEGRMQGWGDDPLSPTGVAQARQLAAWLRENEQGIDCLFASPLKRAYQTAEAISNALDLPIVVRDGLRELGIGELEDQHYSVLPNALAEPHFEENYDVETLVEFAERVLGTLYGIMTINPGKTIMVVAHGGIVGVALAHWIDHDISRTWTTHGRSRNTSITELHYTNRVSLVYHDKVEHL